MFGDHKKHDVLPLDESYKKLQTKIGESLTNGNLNPKKINYTVFEIKHAAYLCIQEKENMKSRVRRVFEGIKRACIDREKEIMIEIDSSINQNIEFLSKVEMKWQSKYVMCLEILYLIGLIEEKKISNADLMSRANDIYEKLESLNESYDCDDISVPSEAEFTLEILQSGNKFQVSHEALIENIQRMGVLKDKKLINYKMWQLIVYDIIMLNE